MVLRNPGLDKLPKSYLFSEIGERVGAFQAANPGIELVNLGIGDTTKPLPCLVTEELERSSHLLSTRHGYQGYGDVEGDLVLRSDIARVFYEGISPDEIFISDGAKCDMGRLQFLFSSDCLVGVQDPTYPVYSDATLLAGRKLTLLPCTPANDFFPELPEKLDILYFCAPNNPTGATPTYAQLEELVSWAHKAGALIIYDTAYAAFIQGDDIPRTIYAVPGAREVAIETGSFSKLAGFTGLRLGWTVVPNALKFASGSSVGDAWRRVIASTFNGTSCLAQAAGRAVLTGEGLEEIRRQISHYQENAAVLREALEENGVPVYGGLHAPYLWAHFEGRSSWRVFDHLLEEAHLITTPGVGFGPAGEGFVRLSSFGEVRRAVQRLRETFVSPCL